MVRILWRDLIMLCINGSKQSLFDTTVPVGRFASNTPTLFKKSCLKNNTTLHLFHVYMKTSVWTFRHYMSNIFQKIKTVFVTFFNFIKNKK
jgi:hypothetical protein